MLNQKLQQKLLQKLSPQQILLMKLLQIPSMALEQRIKQEIEENPALEEIGELDNPEDKEEEENGEDEDENEIEENKEDEFDLDDYLDDDEIPSYKLSANNRSPDDERKEIPFASGTSFQEI
ncbi:MAG: RNA polymerase sigma-54 factor, partial [Bacteroidales bacterium]|nr:RNA polymerase sigma-54 factor [Bacteroidales bacterium]